jgi:pyrimidine operon attenuation protein/uracil phosphoribosyltransferase
MEEKTLILNDRQIQHKIKRIAFQILEVYDHNSELIIAGISENGYIFAQKLVECIKKVSDTKPKLCEIKIDKKKPKDIPFISLSPEEYENQSFILADDVLNTGTTLIYAVKHLLETDLKVLKTAVLIDRSHKKFPIKADFKGLSLSTSLHEIVKVSFDRESKAVLY